VIRFHPEDHEHLRNTFLNLICTDGERCSDANESSDTDTIVSVTSRQLQQLLCGRAKRFTLPMKVVRDRLGSPSEIRILHKWDSSSGRDVVLMTYAADDGSVDVFCPIGFINDEETVIDGWFGAQSQAALTDDPKSPDVPRQRGIDHLRGLFDSATEDNSQTGPSDIVASPEWRKAEQRSFGDENDESEPTT